MTSAYIRTTPREFNELPETEQTRILQDMELSDATSTQWIKDPCKNDEYLSLNEFMITDRAFTRQHNNCFRPIRLFMLYDHI
jgi:uncharacterized protein YfbU (UPF0304 family)